MTFLLGSAGEKTKSRVCELLCIGPILNKAFTEKLIQFRLVNSVVINATTRYVNVTFVTQIDMRRLRHPIRKPLF